MARKGRSLTILRTTSAGAVGLPVRRTRAVHDPGGPSPRDGAAHFAAVFHNTSYRSAARVGGYPWSTINRASRSRGGGGVGAAFEWLA